MRIIIRSKNIKPSQAINQFIEEKIGSLQKFVDIMREKSEIGKPPVEVFVDIEKETKHHYKGPFFKTTIQMHLPGRSLRSEARSIDLNTAIVEVKDELQREIKKYKIKTKVVSRRKQRSIKKNLHLSPEARFNK